jgi:hypothetical protein
MTDIQWDPPNPPGQQTWQEAYDAELLLGDERLPLVRERLTADGG